MKLLQGDFSEIPITRLCDLICCDPPYNISRELHCLDWEGNTIPTMKFDKDDDWDSKTREEYISLLNQWTCIFGKVLRPGGQFLSFCADRYISHYWEALEKNGIIPKRIFTWVKPNAVPFNRKFTFLSSCEYALWGNKPGKNKTFNYQKENQHNYKILSVVPGNRLHPNQKPLEIIKYFIETLSNSGDVVLDPFMGSGTTGVACVETGRDFIGIEKDEKYFQIAKNRIESTEPETDFIDRFMK